MCAGALIPRGPSDALPHVLTSGARGRREVAEDSIAAPDLYTARKAGPVERAEGSADRMSDPEKGHSQRPPWFLALRLRA